MCVTLYLPCLCDWQPSDCSVAGQQAGRSQTPDGRTDLRGNGRRHCGHEIGWSPDLMVPGHPHDLRHRYKGQRPSRMDVIPAGPAHRRWSAEAKVRIIASSFEPGANIAEIARTHGLLPQQLYAWRHDSIPGKRLASKSWASSRRWLKMQASEQNECSTATMIINRTAQELWLIVL